VWEDNIKTELKVTACEGVEWIQLAQDTVEAKPLSCLTRYEMSAERKTYNAFRQPYKPRNVDDFCKKGN
jgi:hypothetical protein